MPISTLMSMAFLGERIGWRRGLGIMLSFAGVMLIAFDPTSFRISTGLMYVVACAFIGSYGGILMKQMPALTGLQVQAWITHSEVAAVDFVHGEGLLMAPTVAVPRMLDAAGISLQDFDFYEIHEAFAAQVLCTLKAWSDADAQSLFAQLGLTEHLTPQRSNGVRAMVERIRADARAALEDA